MPPASEEQFALISAALSPDNTLIAAVASKRIRVVGLLMVAAGAVVARFESDTGGTALTGAMSLITGTPIQLYNPLGLFETDVANELLNLELSAAVLVAGFMTYHLID